MGNADLHSDDSDHQLKVRAVTSALQELRADIVDEIDEDTTLFDPDGRDLTSLGLDSLNMVELMVDLEERTGLFLPADVDPRSIGTVGMLARALRPTRGTPSEAGSSSIRNSLPTEHGSA